MQTGFVNLRNTCYFNTSLQCLLCIDDFRTFVLTYMNSGPVLSHLADMYALQPKKPVNPERLLRALASALGDKMHLGEQNDMQEFVLLFVGELVKQLGRTIDAPVVAKYDRMQRDTALDVDARFKACMDHAWLLANRREYSAVVPLFFGQQIMQLECDRCGDVQHNYENFMSIPLAFPGDRAASSIQRMLDDFMATEAVPSRRCDGCGRTCAATKMHRLWRLPRVLMLFVKRFDATLRKIDADIDVGPTLDMTKYYVDRKKPPSSRGEYELVSVGCHTGSMGSGHYFALCRDDAQSCAQPGWKLYDDDCVRTIASYTDVPSSKYYTLFYRSVN